MIVDEDSLRQWSDVQPDALFRVKLWATEDGGLSHSIGGGIPWVGFPLHIDDGVPHMNDCRLLLGRHPLEPGSSRDVPVAYLSPDEALTRFPVGAMVTLWAGRFVGEAMVLATSRSETRLPTLREMGLG